MALQEPKKYEAKPVQVMALRYFGQLTTRSDILAFCPGANIGSADADESDIRWLYIPRPTGGFDEVKAGDFITRTTLGDYQVLSALEFARRYQEVH